MQIIRNIYINRKMGENKKYERNNQPRKNHQQQKKNEKYYKQRNRPVKYLKSMAMASPFIRHSCS